jgi:hypothetical protein
VLGSLDQWQTAVFGALASICLNNLPAAVLLRLTRRNTHARVGIAVVPVSLGLALVALYAASVG